jgi:Ca-activated chloride channel homolog
MDPTQRIDPNRTVLTGAPGLADPLRTQAMDPLAPQPPPGLSATIIPGRECSMANGPAREAFLLQLHGGGAPGWGGGVRTPLNLCLVIDRSGSMEGAPLEYVKQACQYVVDLLGPNDVLSIVTFEETVEVLMPPQRVTDKQPIKEGIQRLMPGNTTNLYDGMLLGLQQVASIPDAGRATRLVVLTDGEPTSGIKDFQALVSHAGEIKQRGVTCTFLGFGPDYNEELLAAMAKRAGGNYYYIPSPEQIPNVFRSELEKLMTLVARNLRVDLKLARWVALRSPQAASSGEVQVPLADLERGATLEQVFDFEFPNHPLGHYRVASGRLVYDDCQSGRTESIDLDFVLEFTADATQYGVPVDSQVRQAMDLAVASRTVERTVMGLKTGALTAMGAMQELQKTQALLLQEGRTAEAQEVTMALRAIQSGDLGQAEKTLMGTMVHLDQGKR